MPDLLLELRSEEIPARMQRKAAGDLKKMVTDGLVEAGLTYEAAREYWTPRRLTLDIRGLTARSQGRARGEARVRHQGAASRRSRAFCARPACRTIAEAHVHSDPKKGDFYVAHISKPGRAAEEIIAELMPAGDPRLSLAEVDALGRRPSAQAAARCAGCARCNRSSAPSAPRPRSPWWSISRSTASAPATSPTATASMRRARSPCARFDDYAAKLEAAKVILDADRRKEIILSDARNLAFANGLDLVEDEGLLEEVSGLVEWPVVLMGEFEEDFLDIPAEVIRLTIRANQKCFVVRRGARQALAAGSGETHRSPTASSSPPTSRRRTAARRSPTATARWCAPGFPTRCISGRPTRPTCPTSTS